MAKQYYDRYGNFKFGNEMKTVPFIVIPERDTDIYIEYKNRTRLDIVSQTYYGVPYYGWLIMEANPQYGGLEFNIPVGSSIRVPMPIITVLQNYQEQIDRYNVLYKINS